MARPAGSVAADRAAPRLVTTARLPAGATVRDTDVVVVGAGPAGSTTAAYLAQAGLDVVLLEKSAFPREKVCGDGLTPRAVRQLIRLGIDTSPEAGWLRNHGLRILGGGMRLELPWPELATFPDYGLVRPRSEFDQLLARHAVKLGAALLERTPVGAPLVDDRTSRVVGVVATTDGGNRTLVVRAPVVVAADGNSSRLALALGRHQLATRPMGVAYRRYYASTRSDDTWLESWLELRDHSGGRDRLLPGYGWIFGMGDGTSNVGVGILNTSAAFRAIDYRALLRRWVATMPEEWGICEETARGPIRGAALPMGFTRKPHYSDGLLLVGDAGGMINPCNGEGIAYAMESGELAAEIIAQALARRTPAARERVLRSYPAALADRYGGYYTLARWFVSLIGKPGVMQFLTRHGLPHPTLMRFTLKFLANLTDPKDGDAMDRIINAVSRWAPAA
ncbi:MAG: geranylgeranyl reductase family protein [Acidothermus sp.]|nr:geranylgeranyl reductase family protein [Acidothermus sp.]MCL6537830.1 geranylgeranyl reductase family protein [Acidothermus sp.]